MPPNARPERRLSRLDPYDYRRGGWYFVTICTMDRTLLFGSIEDGTMTPSVLGEIAAAQWEHTFVLRPYVVGDAFVVMPNHVHLLFGISDAAEVTRDTDMAPGADMARHVRAHAVPPSPAEQTQATSPPS